MKYPGLILALTLGLAACTGTNKVKDDSTAGTKKKVACAKTHIDEGAPHIDWFDEKDEVLDGAKEVVVLPKVHKLYSISTLQADNFFNIVNNDTVLTTIIPLPQPAGCQVFTIRKHIPENARIPAGTVVTKGDALGQEAMITYSENKFYAFIKWFDNEFIVTPITAHEQTYYLVYTKEKDVIERPQDAKADPATIRMIENKPVR